MFRYFLGLSWLCVVASASWAADRPNILFVVFDDLNTHVSAAGYEHIRTPGFDAIAADAMTFGRAYCQYPVCGPSRASFLSGLYPESSGVLQQKDDIREKAPGLVTLPEFLRRSGYWTARTGKIYHNEKMNPRETAWDESPERFDNDTLAVEQEARAAFVAKFGPPTRKNRDRYKAFVAEYATQLRGQTTPGYGPTDLDDDGHKDGKNALQVDAWLRERAFGDKPFFIACGFQKPHVPFLAPRRYFDANPLDEMVLARNPSDDWADIPKLALTRRYVGFGFEAQVENEDLARDYMQAYHACIAFVDAQLDRVMASLKEAGLYDETIVIVTSDHGYHLGEHYMWGKVTLFEECARVPMLVRVPGLTSPGSSSDAFVELVDLYPTLATLAGIDMLHAGDGESLVDVLGGSSPAVRDTAYTVVSRGEQLGRSIRTDRFRYSEWGGPEAAELYDLQADPDAFTNLIDDVGFAAVREELATTLAEKSGGLSPRP